MRVRRVPTRSRAGYTLIEVLIGALLMAGLLLVAGISTDRAMGLFRQRSAAEIVSTRANRALQRVASELVFARRSSILPVNMDDGSSTISFQKSEGVIGAVTQWSDTFALRWEMEPGEADDGVDNDGDGLVDEGRLVLIQHLGLANEQQVVMAGGLCEFLPGESFDGADEDADGLVDERGLCFSMNGDVVTVQLGLQGTGPNQNTITRVVETSILIRNAN